VSRKLKIAFDAKRLFHNREGLGSYARTIVSDLATFYPEHEYVLCTPKVGSNTYAQSFIDNPQFTILTPTAYSLGSWWRTKGILKALEAEKVDIYFGLSNELPLGIAQSHVRSIVMIHDLLYKEFPQQFSSVDRLIYDFKFKHAIKAADQILATSHHTKKDILKHFGVPADPIQVTYQPINEAYRGVSRDFHVEDYYLMVGTINERKNLRLVIEAYNKMEQEHRKKVIVVGKQSAYKDKMLALIEQYSLGQWFEFRSGVLVDSLIKLYQQARALFGR